MKWFSSRFKRDIEFYRFTKKNLGVALMYKGYVKEAFTHKNARENQHSDQERLEFIGDALIGWIVARTVFTEFPELQEGDLSKMRSKLVNRKYLNQQSKQVGLFQWCEHEFDENTIPENLHGNILEALVGAVYLVKGYKTARKLVDNLIPSSTFEPHETELVDPKSRVYIWVQKQGKEINFEETPIFDSEERITGFNSTLTIESMGEFKGKGLSKKEAQMKASIEACHVLF